MDGWTKEKMADGGMGRWMDGRADGCVTVEVNTGILFHNNL